MLGLLCIEMKLSTENTTSKDKIRAYSMVLVPRQKRKENPDTDLHFCWAGLRRRQTSPAQPSLPNNSPRPVTSPHFPHQQQRASAAADEAEQLAFAPRNPTRPPQHSRDALRPCPRPRHPDSRRGSTAAPPCRTHDCLPARSRRACSSCCAPLLPFARGNSPRSTGPRQVRANHAAALRGTMCVCTDPAPRGGRGEGDPWRIGASGHWHATPGHDRVRRFAQSGRLTALRHSSCPSRTQLG
jgi:hypothetical protein